MLETISQALQTGWQNVQAHDGVSLSLIGAMWVFFGLLLINISVHISNAIFGKLSAEEVETPTNSIEQEIEDNSSEVPLEHRLAIFATIELYRKLHFDVPESRLTFKRGQEQLNGWKMGNKFGQRG